MPGDDMPAMTDDDTKEQRTMIGRNTAAGDKLTAYADRIERLLDEIDGLKQDLKDVKAEALSEGFNVQALVKLVAIRRNKKRADAEAVLLNDLLLYAHATGTPLDVALASDDWHSSRDDASRTEDRIRPAGDEGAPAGHAPADVE